MNSKWPCCPSWQTQGACALKLIFPLWLWSYKKVFAKYFARRKEVQNNPVRGRRPLGTKFRGFFQSLFKVFHSQFGRDPFPPMEKRGISRPCPALSFSSLKGKLSFFSCFPIKIFCKRGRGGGGRGREGGRVGGRRNLAEMQTTEL